MTNSLVLVEREEISGRIEGVDFGPALKVIARAPNVMLVWDPGHTFTSGQNSHSYGESQLVLILNRQLGSSWGTRGGRRDYQYLGRTGGRFSSGRVVDAAATLVEHFGEAAFDGIIGAARQRKTLLIDGGGDTPMPSRRLGEAAYREWKLRSKPI